MILSLQNLCWNWTHVLIALRNGICKEWLSHEDSALMCESNACKTGVAENSLAHSSFLLCDGTAFVLQRTQQNGATPQAENRPHQTSNLSAPCFWFSSFHNCVVLYKLYSLMYFHIVPRISHIFINNNVCCFKYYFRWIFLKKVLILCISVNSENAICITGKGELFSSGYLSKID